MFTKHGSTKRADEPSVREREKFPVQWAGGGGLVKRLVASLLVVFSLIWAPLCVAGSLFDFDAPGTGYWTAHGGGASNNAVGDFNGDGKTDMAGYTGANGVWHVCLSTGTGFNCGWWTGHGGGTSNNALGDFNGDGKTDMAGYTGSNGVWHVCLSTGTGFICGWWTGHGGGTSNNALGDFNGDGRTDMAGYTGAGGVWHVCLSKVTNDGFICGLWTGHGGGTSNNALGDFNGDKKTDMAGYTGNSGVWHVCLSTGTGFSCSYQTAHSGVSSNALGDFNGDGKTDMAGYTGSSGGWHVCLSTGAGFSSGFSCSYQTAHSGVSSNALGDFNGDGRTDMAGYPGSGNSWHVCLSKVTNNGFFDGFDCGWGISHSGVSSNTLGDFNGDGRTDMAGYTGSNGVWHVTLSNQQIVLCPNSTCNVAKTGSDTTGDGSEAKPFATIQHGIDVAQESYSVLVHPGTYVENIKFGNKNIIVKSKEGATKTIIDGNKLGSVATFISDADIALGAAATLQGFTMTNGNGTPGNDDPYRTEFYAGKRLGGGVLCHKTKPILIDSIIAQNSAEKGGGIFGRNCEPTIINTVISKNTAMSDGGGAGFICGYLKRPAFKNVLIVENTATGNGGGIFVDYSTQATMINSTISKNTSGYGHGGAIDRANASGVNLTNSIVWDNGTNPIYWRGGTDYTSQISYSIVQSGQSTSLISWGTGSLDTDPLFIGGGNYHLSNNSPALGKGTLSGAPTNDLEGSLRPNPAGSNPDMGAYEIGLSKDVIFSPNPDKSITISNNEYKMVITPNSDPNAIEVPMQVISKADGSYEGKNGKFTIVASPKTAMRSKRSGKDDLIFVAGKDLTDNGVESSTEVIPNEDGSISVKSAEFPTRIVTINADESNTVTDTEFPGMTTTISPEGNYKLTDAEFPGMTSIISVDKHVVVDEEFPDMMTTVNDDGSYTITDTKFPGIKLAVNPDGSYVVTDEEFPGTLTTFNTDGSYFVTDEEFPGMVATFQIDGSYLVTDDEGNCFTDSGTRKKGWFKKFVAKVAKVVTKNIPIMTAIVKAVEPIVKAVVKVVATVVEKVEKFVAKTASFICKEFEDDFTHAWVFSDTKFSFTPLGNFATSLAETILAYGTLHPVMAVGLFAELTAFTISKLQGSKEKLELFKRTGAWIKNCGVRKGLRQGVRQGDKNNTKQCTAMASYIAYGTIKDKAGNPLVNATVQVGDETTTTDALGNWEIPGLFEGTYDVFATKDNFNCLNSGLELGNEEYLQVVNCEPVTTLKVVVKPDTWAAIGQGEDLTYTITVINGGKDTATGVTLIETLPAGSELVSLEALDGGVCDANTLTCTVPDLTPGATAKLKLVLRATDGNNLKNVLTLTSTEYPVDVQTSWKAVKPYLSVTVTDTPDPVVMLGTLHYTAQVELSANAPQPTATGVTLTLQLPQGVKLETVTTDQGTCDSTQLPLITCQMADLSIATPDSHSVATVKVDVKLADAGLLVLTQDAKVTAKEYPAHTVKTRTNIFVPKDLKVDAVLVLDTTHSMQDELNGVITGLKQFIDKNIDPSLSPTIALIGFKDDVKVLAFTKDLPLLQKVIEGLKAAGGGLCPEASVEALNVALDHVKDHGVIFFSTDASPYDDADMESLAARLKTQQVTFNAVVSGDCGDKESWNEVK